MDGLYELIGQKLKNVFKGYHAWIIGYREEYFHRIGLAASMKMPILNGSLECQLREYVIFEGDYKHFRSQGGRLRELEERKDDRLDSLRDRKKREMRREFKRDFRRDSGKPAPGGKFRKDAKGGARKDSRRDFRRDEERPFSEKRAERREFNAGVPRNKLEERYHPGNRSRDRRDEERRSQENPLAVRRNPQALKSITGKQPTIPVMRSRKGWRKDDESGAQS